MEQKWEARLDSGEAIGNCRECRNGAARIGFDDGFPFAEIVAVRRGGVVRGDNVNGIVVDGLPDGVEIFRGVAEGWRADVFGAFPFFGGGRVVVCEGVGIEG